MDQKDAAEIKKRLDDLDDVVRLTAEMTSVLLLRVAGREVPFADHSSAIEAAQNFLAAPNAFESTREQRTQPSHG